ncbi:MAG: hypothetical protein BV456_06685 [Thermoplasmata archaeon M8B2D]|nr:MAG: hypothetical protein BV456_06685 [Thermoplasmata archaeon M8B2D]
MSIITIPDFDFANFYYAEVLEALLQYKRVNLPKLTDESDVEPSIQLLRAFALVCHLNNVNLDIVANESTLPTAKLTETVRNMLRLIDYELDSATPAQVDIVYELSRVFTVSTLIIPENAQVSTQKTDESDSVYFEALESLTLTNRTDEYSYVLGEEDGTFTDYTTKANSETTPADDWTPWTTPISKDSVYFGHTQIMWDKIGITLTTAMANIIGVLEFYDGNFLKTQPTSVTDLGPNLEIDLTSLLGINNRQGTLVRIQLNSTTAYEDLYSTWDGSKNIITTTGLLGQTTPSEEENDYTIGSDWSILTVTDTTEDFTVDGNISFILPQTITQNWITSEIDNKTAYWLRFRIIYVNTPTSPVFQKVTIDEGKQYVLRNTTQGRTYIENPLGSSTGLPNQNFVTTKDHFLWSSETVTVDNEEWTRVDNFLNSSNASKHYVVQLGENDRATIKFGGNGKGLVPPVGAGNIAITYRYGANLSGNVGYETVDIDKTGLTYINRIWNPRSGTGWKIAEGSTDESLEEAKIKGPYSLRSRYVAVGPDDVEYLATNYIDSNGASPFSRSLAIEEGYGPKTIELVLVASGGGLASASQIESIEEYFNGNKYSNPVIEKHIIANQEVTAVNYTQKIINVVATVYGDIDKEEVENKLYQILQPEAKNDNNEYLWDFGGIVPVSKINHEIFNINSEITKVDITTPSSDTVLQSKELPIAGTLTITIVNPND